MKDFLSSRKFKILIAVLCILIGFMIAAVYSGGSSSVFSDAVSFITLPLQKVSGTISDSTAAFFQKYTDSAALYEDNIELQKEVNELRSKVADYDSLKHENQQFREIIGEMETRKDLTIKPASVIGRDGANRFYSFTLDKGSLDGISYLDPVIDADGLVGYVVEVTLSSAKVRTILDVSIDVGSITSLGSSSRDIGIISGTVDLAAEGLCIMEYLPRDSEIQAGDLVYTSGGGGGLFPKELYIGKVKEVHPDKDGTGKLAVIDPGADVNSVKNVFVITDFPGKEIGNDKPS